MHENGFYISETSPRTTSSSNSGCWCVLRLFILSRQLLEGGFTTSRSYAQVLYILHDVCLDKKYINKKTCLHQACLCSYSILFVGASYANNKIQIRVSIMWQSYVHQNLSAYPEIAFNSVCFPP